VRGVEKEMVWASHTFVIVTNPSNDTSFSQKSSKQQNIVIKLRVKDSNTIAIRKKDSYTIPSYLKIYIP
jgi:hypothetical protein